MPPPSLKNIFKELQDDVGCTIPSHGELVKWAKEGVLLLNTVLTVREGHANSHANKGWEILTDRIISLLNDRSEPIVFLLWGRNAQNKSAMITNPHHFGCRHFSKTNQFLKQHGYAPIDWQIDE